jgi:hypothetical protein
VALGATGANPSFHAFALRWDGRKWKSDDIEDASDHANLLTDVTYVSNNDAWAVGYTQSASGIKASIVEHWDGRRWRLADTPTSLVPGTFLKGVTLAGKDGLWAVGGTESVTGPPFTVTTLTERLCKASGRGRFERNT